MRPLARLLLVLLLLSPVALQAQQPEAEPPARFAAERNLITSTLQTVISVLREATLGTSTDDALGDRLRAMATSLTDATEPFSAAAPATAAPPMPDDLQQLEAALRETLAELRAVRAALEDEGEDALAGRLAPVEASLAEAAQLAARLAYPAPLPQAAAEPGWLQPGHYAEDRPAAAADQAPAFDAEQRAGGAAAQEARQAMREARTRAYGEDAAFAEHPGDPDDRPDRWEVLPRRYDYAQTFVGEWGTHWPYAETFLYRPIPALRYNRVEGFVLGLGLPPLEWDDYERSTIYGQVGYAFSLKDVRYEVGLETRPLRGAYQDDFDFKVGAAYRENTATNDLWKSSWLENTLAASLFEHDFFDYYEVEGWTIYAAQRLTPVAQLSAGYRSDRYRSLENNTSWSLFNGSRDDFRLNPAIDAGLMNSFVFAFEGGRVAGIHRLPRGFAFRTEAEVGSGLGGDFSFNRYLGDVRLYLPVNTFSRLMLRLRGGYATSGVPFQKRFTLGGVGSVRAYPQNWFSGTRLLLGNVEYAIEDVRLLDGLFRDFQLFGFADAGWVNTFGTDAFSFDDLIPAAGFGLGVERNVRLELAWPLRDLTGSTSPSLWLRINPTF